MNTSRFPLNVNRSILLLTIFFFLNACNTVQKKQDIAPSAEMPEEISTEPVKIIFDTDMGSDCDDVGALALLHQYAKEGKAEILGCIYSSGKIRYGAGVIDAINHYYGKPNIPIGANYDTIVGDRVDKMGAENLASDTAKYGHNIVLNKDAIEQATLSRSILASIEEDTSIVYVTVGHTKGLYDLLVSEPDSISPLSGAELIKKKLKSWVALGALRSYNQNGHFVRDWNFFFNGTAPYSEYLVNNLPRPTYFDDGGHDVMTGKSLANTEEGNIVRQAYTDWLNWYGGKTLEDQRPSWDLVTVYYAVIGLGDYFEEAPDGYLSFDANNGCSWIKGENDRSHNFIIQLKNTDLAFANELNIKIAQ